MKIFDIISIVMIISLFPSKAAFSAGTLIKLASTRYDSGNDEEANAVAVDSQDNIIVTGSRNNGGYPDYFTIKYNSDFKMISSVSYTGAAGSTDSATGVAVDSDDNIIITGYTYNGSDEDWLTVKYNSGLVMISSAVYDQGSTDMPHAITVDSRDNIIVSGRSGSDQHTVKYDENLVMLSSAVYAGYYGRGVEVDSQDNIFAACSIYGVKYSSSLQEIDSIQPTKPVFYENEPDIKILGQAIQSGLIIALDSQDNIIMIWTKGIVEYQVTNRPDAGTYGLKIPFITKYDNDLTEIFAEDQELIHGMPTFEANDAAVDRLDNIILAGAGQYTGTRYGYMIKKCNPDGDELSSAFYDINSDEHDKAFGAAIDSRNNIIVTGYTDNGTDKDWFTVKYLGLSPSVTSVSPTSVMRGERTKLTITGKSFYDGLDADLSDAGITVNSVTIESLTQLTVSITAGEDAKLGKRDVTVTNIDAQSGTKTGCIKVTSGTEIDKDKKNTITLDTEKGDVVIEIPPDTFSQDVNMSVQVADVPAAGRDTLKKTDIGIEIDVSSGEQPMEDIILRIYYRDKDIAGLAEDKLSVCRYDSANSRWIPLPTTVYASKNYMEATIDHLSEFGVLELSAAADLGGVLVFPNPYDPDEGSLVFDNLTSDAVIKIYTVSGTLVRKLTETDGNGRCQWDGANDAGETVAGGVYLAYIHDDGHRKTLKIAVVR
ncbi:MAG: hypothetical protein JXJ19_05480 [Elusimicrobia bacterium]|nr:hypothetical protein [Elusimicrobiota bacterium]